MRKKSKAVKVGDTDGELVAKGKAALDDFEEKPSFRVTPKKRASKLISIRIPVELMSRLRFVALSSGDIGYQRLIKRYIAEGLKRDEGLRSELRVEFVSSGSGHSVTTGSRAEEIRSEHGGVLSVVRGGAVGQPAGSSKKDREGRDDGS
jgi:predicted DNA binding CopG/RHH family protein